MEEAVRVYELLKQKGYSCSLINSRFVKPIDREILQSMSETHKLFVTIEEGVRTGGYGESVAFYVMQEALPTKVLVNAIEDQYVEHGDIASLRKEILLSAEAIVEKTIRAYAEC